MGERALDSQRGRLSVAETETLKATLMNDPVKAQKALDTALAANPTYRPARALKATRLLFGRETARAAEDLMRLTADDPTDLYVCGLAMFTLNVLGRFEEALATCPSATRNAVTIERIISLQGANRVGEVSPLFAELNGARAEEVNDLSWRSWRYLEAGNYMAAMRVTDLLSSRAYGSSDAIACQRFVRTVALCLSKLCAEARTDLKRVPIPLGASVWMQSVFRFLTEEIAADALLKGARRPEEETEGHAYIALDLLARGRAAEAQPHLAWVKQKGSPNVTEYFVALAQLERLAVP